MEITIVDTEMVVERIVRAARGDKADTNTIREILSVCSPAQLLDLANYDDEDSLRSIIGACGAHVIELFLEYGISLHPLGSGLFDIIPPFSNDTSTLSLLIDHGVSINNTIQMNRNWLHHAAAQPHLPAVQLVLAHGINIEAVDQTHWSPLCFAVMCIRIEGLEPLLQRYADPNRITDRRLQQQALHIAVNKPFYAATEVLLAYGADCHARTATGDTPLHIAAQHIRHPNALKTIRLLLHYQASVSATNKRGEIPRDVAMAAIKHHVPVNDDEIATALALLAPQDTY